jgi:putative endonuclease
LKFLGDAGENAAAKFLKKKGCVIVKRNWRSPSGEVDIIALDGEVLVFVEVKSRGKGSYVSAVESVDSRKQKRITKAALHYISMLKGPEGPPLVRFDVICVSGGLRPTIEEHIESAFEYHAS